MADDSKDFAISAPAFYFYLAAAAFGGGGVYGIVTPQTEQAVFQACIDKADTAIDVAAQHGDELIYLRRYIDDRTQDRYSGSKALEEWRRQAKIDDHQDKRLDWLEAELKKRN